MGSVSYCSHCGDIGDLPALLVFPEPSGNKGKQAGVVWARQDSNLQPTDYESLQTSSVTLPNDFPAPHAAPQ